MLTRAIALDSLIFLRFPEHSHPSIGMLAGAAFGAAAGYLFVPGPSSEHWETDLGIVKLEGGRTTNTPPGPYVMWGGIVGGVLGYWIGSSIGAERIYDFRTLSMPVKIGAVTSVLRELAESSR
jgi:hypothetical protein